MKHDPKQSKRLRIALTVVAVMLLAGFVYAVTSWIGPSCDPYPVVLKGTAADCATTSP